MIKIFLTLLVCSLLFLSCARKEETPETSGDQNQISRDSREEPEYVGAAVCSSCHQTEYKLWMGSDHQLAMQEANGKTVLGDFNNATFIYNKVQTRFYSKEDSFYVNTDGPDGRLHDYKITFVFGIRPLQQYLIAFPNGRYQVLSIAWDTRAKAEGGQKWFHLYPNERLDYRDALHWTGPYQNWNHMCAECHSTNLKKNYNAAEDKFETTWSEINVACEQCHGPGSRHIAWAKNKSSDSSKGLLLSLKKARVDFPTDHRTGNPVRLRTPLIQNPQVEACAQCHSRRTAIRDPYRHGRPLADTHMPVFLNENLYYPDGQIRDEVYEYDSFLQSKMFAQGVSCSNCHDPHSTKTYIADSRICAQCHAPEKYQSESHHHHKAESTGADCRSCHMPVRSFMVVDARRDHSFRIPRPDLTLTLGTPNACNQCHQNQNPEWAAKAYAKWYGKQTTHFGEIIQAARLRKGNLESELLNLIADPNIAGVVRATALVELQHYLSPRSLNVLSEATRSDDPLLRLASLRTLQSVEPRLQMDLVFPMIKDPIRAIRIEAVSLLSKIPRALLTAEQQTEVDRASSEYVEVQTLNADRPDAQMNLGNFYANTGKYPKGESAYRKAIHLQPSMIQAYVNLADLYRVQNADSKGEVILKQSLQLEPQNPEANLALGLLLIRLHRSTEAVSHLAIAAQQGTDPHYAYIYAIALNSAGKSTDALAVLKNATLRFPGDREILYAVISIAHDSGDNLSENEYKNKLFSLYPDEKNTQ